MVMLAPLDKRDRNGRLRDVVEAGRIDDAAALGDARGRRQADRRGVGRIGDRSRCRNGVDCQIFKVAR